jgi:hypothetical protein
MSRGRGWSRIGFTPIALVALMIGGAAREISRAQESPPAAPVAPPSQAAPASVDDRVARLEQLVATQKLEIEKLHRVVDGLVDGSQKLSNAAEQALIKGFVSAGPNPDARVELLNGLSAFGESVKAAVAPPAGTKPGAAPTDAPKKQ